MAQTAHPDLDEWKAKGVWVDAPPALDHFAAYWYGRSMELPAILSIALPDSKLTANLLPLLRIRHAELLNRECYQDLYDRICNFHGRGATMGVLVTGQPGIGMFVISPFILSVPPTNLRQVRRSPLLPHPPTAREENHAVHIGIKHDALPRRTRICLFRSWDRCKRHSQTARGGLTVVFNRHGPSESGTTRSSHHHGCIPSTGLVPESVSL